MATKAKKKAATKKAKKPAAAKKAKKPAAAKKAKKPAAAKKAKKPAAAKKAKKPAATKKKAPAKKRAVTKKAPAKRRAPTQKNAPAKTKAPVAPRAAPAIPPRQPTIPPPPRKSTRPPPPAPPRVTGGDPHRASARPPAKAPSAPPPARRSTRPSPRPSTRPIRHPSTIPPPRLTSRAPPSRRSRPAPSAPPTSERAIARLTSLWQRLEGWFAENTDVSLALRPPATERKIEKAEADLGIRFPASYRASLAVHDGQNEDFAIDWLPGGGRLAPLDAIIAHWRDEQDWVDPDDAEFHRLQHEDRFRSVLRHPKRIAIAGSLHWDQTNMYLDLIPGPKGTEGQIAQLVSECDFVLIGKTFEHFLGRYVSLLEQKKLIFVPGEPGKIDLAEKKSPWDGIVKPLAL